VKPNLFSRSSVAPQRPTRRRPSRILQHGQRRVFASWILVPLILLTFAVALRAQFTYTVTNDTVTITGYASSGGDVTLPSTIDGLPVTSIGDRALQCLYSLTNLTIPDSIMSIGNGAFTYCRNLTNVTIGSNVTNIGDSAFEGCTSLINVMLPVSAASIGNSAFNGCVGLRNILIPNDVISIGAGVFSGCTGLTNVTIGESVIEIGAAPFQQCTNLMAVTVDPLNSVISCAGGVLFNQSQTVLYEYLAGNAGASYTIPKSVTKVGSSAFSGCNSLRNITIPNSVISIGDGAFYYCRNLTSVTIPNSVTNIGSYAFYCCFGLTNATIGNSVSSIGDHAFCYCTSLTSVVVGSSVVSVGDDAFAWCNGLPSITIPESVSSFGYGVFVDCYLLRSVYCKGNAPSGDDPNLFYCAGDGTVYYLPGTIGWGPTFGGRPTMLWKPQVQTTDANFGMRGNQFGFNVTGTVDIPVVLEASTNLASPVWSPLRSMTLTNGLVYFSDPQWTNYPGRFYRLRAP